MLKKSVIIKYLAEFPNYLSYFFLSVFITLPAPILIEIGESFNTDPKDISIIFSIFAVGSIIGRTTSFYLRKRFKIFNIIITCYLLLTVFIALLSQIDDLLFFYIAYFFSGLFLGIILIMSSELLIESQVENKNRLLTIAATFFPAGSVITPIMITTMVKNGLDWKYMYYIILALALFTIASYVQITARNKYNTSVKEVRNIKFKEVFTEKRKNIIFSITVFIIILYIISEFIIAQWTPTYFRIQKSFEVHTTGILVSVFWLAVTFGRFLTSFIFKKINSYIVIIIISITATISIFFLIKSGTYAAALIAIIFTGLGFSSTYPILLASGSTIYKKGRGLLNAAILFANGIASVIAPYITQLISKINITWSVLFSTVLMALLVAAVIFLNFYAKQTAPEGS